jgi:hypothetical protein
MIKYTINQRSKNYSFSQADFLSFYYMYIHVVEINDPWDGANFNPRATI